jgi:hypothetical protein
VSVSLTLEARAALQEARRNMSAEAGEDLTLSDVLVRVINSYNEEAKT